jgi:hypothetical protein
MRLAIGVKTASAFVAALGLGLATGPESPPPAAPSSLAAPTRSASQFQRTYTVPYDGKFTFTRIRYSSGRSSFGFRGSAWNHDWPMADLNMQTMLNEFTAVRATEADRGSNVYELEDGEIFQNPILYVSEPGTWGITPEGAANLREFLLKGGFLIFDDFEEDQWYNMADQVAQALPEGQWVEIGPEHPIFNTFFYVENIYVPHPLVRVTPSYRVIFEGNDPGARIMVLANHNSDLAEYWEYAAQGYFAVDPTNDAFRLGINYIVYGMTR